MIKNIGLKRGTVKVVPYNPKWPEYFEEEKLLLLQAIGDKVHSIEHIGSTSVPGLEAKPLIDMLAAIDSLDDYKQLIEPLSKLGYEFLPERVFKERVFFPKGPRSNRTHHLSFSVKGSDNWHKTIHFRDYLRTHSAARDEYAKLKRSLAKKYGSDRAAYTAAKEEFFTLIFKASEEVPN